MITNPDMLHSGILPNHHRRWRTFLSRLRYIVVDEVHTYRGAFGSHVANVMRRLLRVCEMHGSRPTFVCSSATIGNPERTCRRTVSATVSGHFPRWRAAASPRSVSGQSARRPKPGPCAVSQRNVVDQHSADPRSVAAGRANDLFLPGPAASRTTMPRGAGRASRVAQPGPTVPRRSAPQRTTAAGTGSGDGASDDDHQHQCAWSWGSISAISTCASSADIQVRLPVSGNRLGVSAAAVRKPSWSTSLVIRRSISTW